MADLLRDVLQLHVLGGLAGCSLIGALGGYPRRNFL